MLSEHEKQINSGQMTTENPLFQLPKSLATNLFANQGLPPEAIAALKEIQTSSETDADDSSDDEGLNNLKSLLEEDANKSEKDPWGLQWPASENQGTEMKVFNVTLPGSDEGVPGDNKLDLD